MKSKFLNSYWHPFLVSLFPILFLFVHNIGYAPAEDIILPIIATVIFTILIIGLANLFLKGTLKASILASSFLLLFFTYGAVYATLQYSAIKLIHKHSVILSFEGGILVLVFWFLYRQKEKPENLHKVINVFTIILISLPLTQLFFYFIKGNLTSGSYSNKLAATEWRTSISKDQRPDIVYIILDGYGRKDILQKYYSLNNKPFLDSLQAQGFQVADKSTSNYCRTVASVASSLNLDYIQHIDPKIPEFCITDLENLIENAALLKFLVKQNYYLYGFASGYIHTELTKHVNLIKPYSSLPPFYYMVLNKTPYLLLEENAYLLEKYNQFRKHFLNDKETYFAYHDTHRDMILYSLNHIPDFVGRPEPSFIFADVFVGHPPFIFDQKGNYTPAKEGNSLADGDQFSESLNTDREEYIKGCREQTIFLNKKIIATIKQIRKSRKRPTIIVLQGDHGPGAYFSQKILKNTNIEERFSNLTAIYFSDRKPNLPNDVSPVNIFRYVLNNYFGTKLAIKPNHQYYSPENEPCNFTDVTEAYKNLQHPEKQ